MTCLLYTVSHFYFYPDISKSNFTGFQLLNGEKKVKIFLKIRHAFFFCYKCLMCGLIHALPLLLWVDACIKSTLPCVCVSAFFLFCLTPPVIFSRLLLWTLLVVENERRTGKELSLLTREPLAFSTSCLRRGRLRCGHGKRNVSHFLCS